MNAELLEQLLCQPIYGYKEICQFENCTKPHAYQIINSCIKDYDGGTDRGEHACTRRSYLRYKSTTLEEELEIVNTLRRPYIEKMASETISQNLSDKTIESWLSSHSINEEEASVLRNVFHKKSFRPQDIFSKEAN